jgi:predicted choloylglycine hydrolase
MAKQIMTNNEKLINIAGTVVFLRDLLEDANFDKELKARTKNYLAYLNRKVEQIADNPEVWQELEQLVNHFHDNMVIEQK